MSCQITPCVLLLLAAVLPCAASATTDQPPPGYHDVTIGSGANKSVVRVRDTPKPHFQDGSSSDADSTAKYNPQNMDLGKSSPLANKTFDSGFASLSKNDTANEAQNPKSFITQSFATTTYDPSTSQYQTVAYNESSHRNDDFGKTYALPSTDPGANRTFAINTSAYQGKSAQEAQKSSQVDPFATPSSLSDKTFFDPNLKKVKQDPYATGYDVKRLADLPNRTLTIDEVRNLINHDQRPNLDSAPDDDPSKALNDPDWEPPTFVPPARTPEQIRNSLVHGTIPTAPPAEAEKDGDLPAPGEMAQPPPENSEPLPK